MVLQAPCVAGAWLQVVPVVVIAFVQSPSSGCTLLEAGFCRDGNGWFPTASRRSNGCSQNYFDRIWSRSSPMPQSTSYR